MHRLARIFDVTRYPLIAVLVLLAGFAVIFAFVTFNLFGMAMANLNFLQRYGWTAVMEGGLVQLVEIIGSGLVSLLAYLGFKICENELMLRYRRWVGR